MSDTRNSDSRTRLLEAAAELIAATPGQDVSLRSICDRAGVRLPTLYHFFGNKEGLVGAVLEHGFEVYVGAKQDGEGSGDPIQDIRDGWDAHVAFGLANPGFYALMYGHATPGKRPAAQDRPTAILLELTRRAEREGRLSVPAERAAAHVLSANVGVTLHQIVDGLPDPGLSAQVRDATVAAITGTGRAGDGPGSPGPGVAEAAAALLERLGRDGTPLEEAETVLLKKWLGRLARG